MRSIRQIQHPQQAEFAGVCRLLAGDGPIEPSSPQLWLPLRILIQIGSVMFKDVEHGDAMPKRLSERHGLNKVEIVRRRMILRVLAVWSSHETPDRQVESR